MKLQPNDVVLTGTWLYDGRSMRGDDICNRIEWLIDSELTKIASSPEWGDWETLFQDPEDGRYWERTYPQSHMHGGGPPQLRLINVSEAKGKYGI